MCTHTHAHTAGHAHKQTTHVDTHAYAHSMCRHAHTSICAFILFSNRQTNVLYSHTRHIYVYTNTHLYVHVYVCKASPNIMNNAERRPHSLACTSCSKLCRTLLCMNTQTHSWKFCVGCVTAACACTSVGW